MFTGIVEHVGRVEQVERLDSLVRLRIDAGPVAEGVKLGDSIAVLGVCLTVTEIAGNLLAFDAIAETLSRTRLGELGEGSVVNLERAMAAGARFDGHIVQGHVDGVGRVRGFEREVDDVELHVQCEEALASQLVDKGSVTIDGVSLTVVDVVADGFHVALIPHTLEVTTLSTLDVGDAIHLEVDVFGKYVKRYLDRVLPNLVAGSLGARGDVSG
jgi:riboflavin synthase